LSKNSGSIKKATLRERGLKVIRDFTFATHAFSEEISVSIDSCLKKSFTFVFLGLEDNLNLFSDVDSTTFVLAIFGGGEGGERTGLYSNPD
jgi:hypothetical protein